MTQTKHTVAQMIAAVKQMEAGRAAAEVGREFGVSKHAVYAREAEDRGVDADEARRQRNPGRCGRGGYGRAGGNRSA